MKGGLPRGLGRDALRVVYHMSKFKVVYQAATAAREGKGARDREGTYLQRKSARLGLTLSPLPASPHVVSCQAGAGRPPYLSAQSLF